MLEFARVCVLLVPLSVSGCSWYEYSYVVSSFFFLDEPDLDLGRRPRVNLQIAFDYAFFITRAPLEEALTKLSATDWFAQREQMLRDYKDDMALLPWEVVPGQIIATPADGSAAPSAARCRLSVCRR